MNKLSDLELCKKIAEIEGVIHWVGNEGDTIVNCSGEMMIYNPFKKALLWDLRLKHKVEIDDECKTCRIWSTPGGDCFVVDYETDEDLPRAMLDAIVEANNV